VPLLSKLVATGGSGSVVIAAFLLGCGVTAALVALMIRVCRHNSWLARPREGRWHKSTPCFFGGVPLWLGFIVSSLVVVPLSNHLVWNVIGVSSLMFGLGLADDIWHLRPRTKLLVQIAGAVLVLNCGVVYPLRESWWLNLLVSLFWLVGITNAFNLLDNMDGLSAGVAVVAALYLSMFYSSGGLSAYAVLVAVAAGAAAGFLIFNFNPASIFMGDAGSLFLGFLLGSSSLLGITHLSGVPALVFAPALMLAIPIFDTLFVSITRRLRGQRASEGGTDHSSHRLVRLGLNERNAVLVLYALSIASGALALVLRKLLFPRAIALLGCWFLFLLLFGIHLFQSDDVHGTSEQRVAQWFRNLLTRDRLAFLIDPLVLSFSYYLAYFLRFRSTVPQAEWTLFLHSWPIVLTAKFICLWWFRVYRRSWWRGSLVDVYLVGEAIVAGEVIILIALTGLFRFEGYSRIVFLLDAIFSWVLLLAVRSSFPIFRDSIHTWRLPVNSRRKVFVLGTSEHAELAIRFLRDSRIECAGLIDTNGGSDLGRCVWGMQVVGRLDDLDRLSVQLGVTEVVQPENEIVPFSDADLSEYCKQRRLHLTRLGLFPAGDPGNSVLRDVA
jgi:UDP-GlcNAc:undecaprenyl-phosphate/decaprenyl-phosphate GlcNAc-1-phosphate transferase